MLDDSMLKNKEWISKIKDICSKYFENYDETLRKIEHKVNSVNSTFEDWTNHVMKP